MSDILSSKLYEINDSCYFISSSIEQPFIFNRFKGTIKQRAIVADNVSYQISVDEILEQKDYCQQFIHRRTFRVYTKSGRRGQLKKISCFDLTLNWPTFNSEFSKRYKDIMIIVPSVFVYDTELLMNEHMSKTVNIMTSHFNESLKSLTIRSSFL